MKITVILENTCNLSLGDASELIDNNHQSKQCTAIVTGRSHNTVYVELTFNTAAAFTEENLLAEKMALTKIMPKPPTPPTRAEATTDLPSAPKPFNMAALGGLFGTMSINPSSTATTEYTEMSGSAAAAGGAAGTADPAAHPLLKFITKNSREAESGSAAAAGGAGRATDTTHLETNPLFKLIAESDRKVQEKNAADTQTSTSRNQFILTVSVYSFADEIEGLPNKKAAITASIKYLNAQLASKNHLVEGRFNYLSRTRFTAEKTRFPEFIEVHMLGHSPAQEEQFMDKSHDSSDFQEWVRKQYLAGFEEYKKTQISSSFGHK